MWERDRGSNRKVMEMNDNGAVALSQRNDKIIEKKEGKVKSGGISII